MVWLARSPREQWSLFPPKWCGRVKIQTHWDRLTFQRSFSQRLQLPTPHLPTPQLPRRQGEGEAGGSAPSPAESAGRFRGGRWPRAARREGRPHKARLAARQPGGTEKKAPPGRRCARGAWVRWSPSRGQRWAPRFPKNVRCYISNRDL